MYKKTAFIASLALMGSALAKVPSAPYATCPCPQLSKEEVITIYEGTFKDKNYRIATRSPLDRDHQKKISKVKLQAPVVSADGACVCEYQVLDKSGKVMDEVALEPMESTAQDQEYN